MLSKLLTLILLIGGAFGYIYYNQTERTIAELKVEILSKQNLLTAYETREAEQEKTIQALQVLEDGIIKQKEEMKEHRANSFDSHDVNNSQNILV